MNSIALYPGSFDPLTRGHLDILYRATQTFDLVVIASAFNPAKKGFFAIEQRVELISQSIREWENPKLAEALDHGRISVASYQEISIIKYAHDIGATHIVRGLRQAGDFNDEFALAGVAGHLDSDVIFTHFIGQEKYLHISSSTARELASLDEDISWLVTPSVEKALRDEFAFRKLYSKPEG